MRRYLVLIKCSLMRMLAHRISILVEVTLNILYLVLFYYFWKAIYFKQTVIHGMMFHQAFVYIVFASLITATINTLVEVHIAYQVSSGNIVYDLVRPLNYQLRTLVESIGEVIPRLSYYTIPVLIAFLLIFKTEIPFGINIPYFFVSLAFSFLINYLISFTFGLLGLYTQAAWGISIFKNFIVSLFSGALIPLNFFPNVLQKIAFLLPFHTIINTPLKLITATELSGVVAFNYLIGQALWAVVFLVINIFLFKRLINTLIVNGG